MKGLASSFMVAAIIVAGFALPSVSKRSYVPPWVCEWVPLLCDR